MPPKTAMPKPAEAHVTDIADLGIVVSATTKIFVNASVLRNASKVFRIMLGPDFLEGHTIVNSSNRQIPFIDLPEDKPKAMLTLMRLLHHRHRDIELAGQLECNVVHEIAVLADKYDVCDAVRSVLATLPIALDQAPPKDLWYVLSAAYLVGHRGAFSNISVQLLLEGSVPFLDLVRECKTRRDSDLWMAAMHEAKRSQLCTKVSREIIDRMGVIISESGPIKHAEDFTNYVYMGEDYPLGRTIQELKNAVGTRPTTEDPTTVETLLEGLENDIAEGICFDCVGNFGVHTGQHDPATKCIF
ncbi:hypothetical protein F5X68DRAFT_263302 [Plectosphaerella plurivora]|uniref:BTB domain-containing protein n=1 Tax=Plectosphaerella plurivora TaxID=936078 RepID=A0A9P8V9A3_9PEZI|nr:hypothetical protein F5X68DRAFT_263302 [Plectosphaerella plurivora]